MTEATEDLVFTGKCPGCSKPQKTTCSPLAPVRLQKLARMSADSMCDPCSDQEERETTALELEESRVLGIERRKRAAQLPPKWAGQSFVDLDEDPARQKARDLAACWGKGTISGLVLWGPVGRGKTALAAAAANLRMEWGGVRWLPVSELLMDLRMPFDSPEYVRAIRRIDAGKSGAALVLDDLDKLKPSEHAVAPIYTAINGWIEAEKPLLVTLNRDLNALEEWLPETFGEAIASRLAGYCQQAQVKGHDRRTG